MIYVGSPYSDPDIGVRQSRYYSVRAFVAHLINETGVFAYSPIVHCHPMAVEHKLPTDADFWFQYNMDIMRRSDAVFILRLAGWQRSKGLNAEISIANLARIPVRHFNPDYAEALDGTNNPNGGPRPE